VAQFQILGFFFIFPSSKSYSGEWKHKEREKVINGNQNLTLLGREEKILVAFVAYSNLKEKIYNIIIIETKL